MQKKDLMNGEKIDQKSREANRELAKERLNKALLLLILFGGIFTFGMLSGVRGVILSLIKTEFNAGYSTQGTLLFINSLANIAFTYFATFLLSRFGIKISSLVNFILAAVSLAVMMLTNSFALVIVVFVFVYSAYNHFTANKNALFRSIFTAKFALWMSILHAFFGLGSAAGPYALSFLMNDLGFGWRQVYLAFSAPMAVFVLITLLARFTYTESKGDEEKVQADGGGTFNITVRESFKMPIVWMFALCSSMAGAVEFGFSNWAITYFKDVFGIDPITTGAMIMSAYFVMFTVSRLFSGFFMEKFGYIKMLVIFGCLELGLMILSFSLGRTGIWIFPIIGFTVSPFFPAQIASMVKVFGRDSTIMMGASGIITGVISALTQYGIGWANTLVGPAWGFRMISIFSLFSIIMHVIFGKRLAKRYGGQV